MIKDHPILSVVTAFFFVWGLTGVSPISTLADFHNSKGEQKNLSASVILAQAVSNTSVSSTNSFGTCPNLTLNLSADDSGNQVRLLQEFLRNTVINGQSVHPTGEVTGFFGPITERAIQRLQSLAGIVSSGDPDTTGYGYVGPRTRAFIALNCGGIGNVLMVDPNAPDFTNNSGSGSGVGGTVSPVGSQTTEEENSNQEDESVPAAASQVGKPDLIVEIQSVGRSTGRMPSQINVRIRNQGGPIPSGSSFTITATPSGEGPVRHVYRGTSSTVGTVTLNSLTPNLNVTSGSYQYSLQVDSANTVSESNEANNTTIVTLSNNISGSSAANSFVQNSDCSLPVDILREIPEGAYSPVVNGVAKTFNVSRPFAFMNRSSAVGGSGGGFSNPSFIKNGYTLRYNKATPVSEMALSCASGRSITAKKYETFLVSCSNGVLGTSEKISEPSLTQEEEQKLRISILTGSCKEDSASPYFKVTPTSPATPRPANNLQDNISLGQPPSTLYDFGCVEEGDTIEFDLELKTLTPQKNIDPVRWRALSIADFIQSELDRNFTIEVQEQLRKDGFIKPPNTPEAIINLSPVTGRKTHVRYTLPRPTPGSDFPYLNPVYGEYVIRSPYTGITLKEDQGITFAPTLSANPNNAQPGFYNHNGDVVHITYAPLPRIAEMNNICTDGSSSQNARIFVYAERGVDMTIPIDHTVVYNPNAVNGRTPLVLRSRAGSTVSWKLAPSQALGVIDTVDKIPTLPESENWIRLANATGNTNSFVIDGLKTRAGQSFSSGNKTFSLYIWDNIAQRPVKHDVYILFNEGFGSNNSAITGPQVTPEQLIRGIEQYKDSVFMLPIWVARPPKDSQGNYTEMQGEANLPGLRSTRGFLDDARFLPGYEPKSTFLYEKRWVIKYAAEANFDQTERARVTLEFAPVLNNLPQIFNQHYGNINFAKYGKYEFVARTYAQESLKRFANVNFALPSVDLLRERVEQFMNASVPEMLKIQILTANDNTMESIKTSTGGSYSGLFPTFKELVPGNVYRFLGAARSDSYTLSVDTFRWYNLEIYNITPNVKFEKYRFWNGSTPNNESVQTWNKLGGVPSGASNAPIDSSVLSGVTSSGANAKPDYQIVSARLLNYQDMVAYVTFRNTGGNFGNNKQVTVTLTPPPSSSINGLQLPSITARINSPLQPGETREIMLNQAHSAIMPSVVPTSGYYTYRITVDSGNILDESNEENNVLDQPVNIRARNNTQYVQSTGSIAESQYYSSGEGATPINLVLEQVREIIGRPLANLTTQISNFTRCQYAEAVTPLLYNDQNSGGLFSRNRCAESGITNVGDSLDAFNVRKLVYTRGVGGAYGVSAAQTGLHLGGINITGAPSGTRLNLLTGEVTFDPSRATTDWRTRATSKGIISPVSFGLVPERKISQQLYDQLITEIRKSGVGAEFKYLLTDPDRNQPSGLPLFETFESKFAELGANNSTVRSQIQSFPWITRPWLQYWFFANGLPHAPEKGWFDQQRQIDVGIIPARDVVNHPLLGRTTARDVGSFERWVYQYMAPTNGIRAFLNQQVSASDRAVLNEIISRLRNENFVGSPGTLSGSGTGQPDYVIDSVVLPFALTPNVTPLQSIEFNLRNAGGSHNNQGGVQIVMRAEPISASNSVSLSSLPRFESNSFVGLGGGGTRSFRVTSPVAQTFPAGTYQYRLTIDTLNFTEGDETNNTYEFTLNVSSAGTPTPSSPPVVTVTTNKDAYTVGENIQATVSVRNNSSNGINIGNGCGGGVITPTLLRNGSSVFILPGAPCSSVPLSQDTILGFSTKTFTVTIPASNFAPGGYVSGAQYVLQANTNLIVGGSIGPNVTGQKTITISDSSSNTTISQKVSLKILRVGHDMTSGTLPNGVSVRVENEYSLSSLNVNPSNVSVSRPTSGRVRVYTTNLADYAEKAAVCNYTGGTECTLPNKSSYTLAQCSSGECYADVPLTVGQNTKVVFLYEIDVVGTFYRVIEGNLQQQRDFNQALINVGLDRYNSNFLGFKQVLYEGNPSNRGLNGFSVYRAWEDAWKNLPATERNVAPYDQTKHNQLCWEYKRIFDQERAYYNGRGDIASANLIPLTSSFTCPGSQPVGTTPSPGVVSSGATITSTSLANVKLFDYDFWRNRGWNVYAPLSEVNRAVDQWNSIVDQIPYGGPEVPLHIARAANQTPENGGPVTFRKYDRVEVPAYYNMERYPYYHHGLSPQNSDIFRNTAPISIQSSGGSLPQSNQTGSSPAFNVGLTVAGNVVGATTIATTGIGLGSIAVGIDAAAASVGATLAAAEVTSLAASQIGIACASGLCYNPYTLIPVAVMALISSFAGKPSVGPNCNADVNVSNNRASAGIARQDNGGNTDACAQMAMAASNTINQVAIAKNATLPSGRAGLIGYFPKKGGFFSNTENPDDGSKEKYFIAPEYSIFVFTFDFLKKNNVNLTPSEAEALYTKVRNDFNEFRRYLKANMTYSEVNGLLTDPQANRE